MEGKVLVTGANGHVGSAIVLHALREGYHVRGTVRSPKKAELVASTALFKTFTADGRLEFVVIADITESDALAEAMIGCVAVIHTAAPVPFGDQKSFDSTASLGTRAILKAADSTSSVKRIVFTSSVFVLFPFSSRTTEAVNNDVPFSGNQNEPKELDPSQVYENQDPTGLPPFYHYTASKIAARNEVIDHVATCKPHWDAILLLPGMVLGTNYVARTTNDVFSASNRLTRFLIGDTDSGPQSLYGLDQSQSLDLAALTCHIDDCAAAHIAALQIAANSLDTYLLLSDGPYGAKWNDAIEVISTEFPEIYAQLSSGTSQGTTHYIYDCSLAETRLLKRPFRPYTQMIKDIYSQWTFLPSSRKSFLNLETIRYS